jgi:hypothetical protein
MATPTPTLSAAYTKLGHSKKHLDTLWGEIVPFLKAHGAPITDERDGTSLKVKTPVLPAIPEHFSLILGDAVQNMRAALDYLIYQLAKLDDPGVDHEKITMFPVFSDPGEFRRNGVRRIRMLSPDHQARIEALQPYKRGNRAARHPLARLIDLSDHDKHRLLVATAHRTFGRPPPLINQLPGGLIEYVFDFDPLEEKAKLGIPANLPVEVEAHLLIAVTLDDGTRLRELRHIGRVVNLILDSFDPDFPTAAAPTAPVSAADWFYGLRPV